MNGLLKDRVAIVTGSTRGIGLAVSRAFAEAGAQVVVTGRSAAEVRDCVRALADCPGDPLGVATDLTEAEAPERLIAETMDRFGAIDILVNNAGVAPAGALRDTSDHDLAHVLNVNLQVAMRCARAGASALFASDDSALINISSIFGRRGRSGYSAYSASKAAIDGFTRALAIEWAPHGVRVNAIAPGYVATRMNEAVRNDHDMLRGLLRQIPLRRFGSAADVAAACLFLASPMSSYVTGQVLTIDGGLSAR